MASLLETTLSDNATDQLSQEQQQDAAMSSSRLEDQDTISQQVTPIAPGSLSRELDIKQEDTAHPPENGSRLHVNAIADNEENEDNEDNEESEADVEEEEHSEADMDDQQDDEKAGTAKGETIDDGELSLSSDNDDDEETASVHPNDDEYSNLPEETVCRWKDCGKVLPSLAALVIHLSDEHIGWKKTSYTCEWQGKETAFERLLFHMRDIRIKHGTVHGYRGHGLTVNLL
jgi:hypothetical protein